MDLYNAQHFKNYAENMSWTNLTKLPRLLPVPGQHHDLTIKATLSGITIIKDGRMKKRYTGAKYSTVDINGKLWESSSDFKKHLEEEKLKREGVKKVRAKKLGSVKTDPAEKISSENEPCPAIPELKDKNTDKVRSYKINKREIRQRLLGFMRTMSGKKELYFWTVTFFKSMPDNLCYQAFNTWLTSLRQSGRLKNYIWVAERQQNGTIHFHIAIPHKLPVVVANRSMRITLTSFAKKGLIDVSTFQCKRYNGVDIAKNRKTGRVTNFANKKGSKSLANYLSKYVTKNNSEFKHLAWHNSRGYSAIFTGVAFTVQEFIRSGFKDYVKKKSIINNKYFMFFAWQGDPPDLIFSHLDQLNDFLQGVLLRKEKNKNWERLAKLN